MFNHLGTRLLNRILYGDPVRADLGTPVTLEEVVAAEDDRPPPDQSQPPEDDDSADVGTVGTEPHHPS